MIGILTFHCTDNYGAVLQAYALKEVISSQFPTKEVGVIDYKCKETVTETKLREIIKNKNLKYAFTHYMSIKSTNKKFEKFRHSYLNLTKEYYSSSEIKADESQFDYYVSGSDQVWNLVWSGNDDIYFQVFNQFTNKKISYAASFGFEKLDDSLVEYYHKNLSSFKGISVREKTGELIVKKQLGLMAERHIDPTLLLNREHWNRIAIKPKMNKYILVYMVPKQDSVIDYAIKLGKKTGLKVVLLSQSIKPLGVKHIHNASPEEFVGWFANAEYVVTNSFHGTAFSIIFHRKFCLELNNVRGLNVRSKDLLELCNISYETDGSVLSIFLDNWEDIDTCLEQERLRAQTYFEKMLS